MKFTMVIEVDGERLQHSVKVPDGEVVSGLVLAHAASLVCNHFLGHAGERMPTESEVAAAMAPALPEGWEPTLDGVSSEFDLGTGGVRYSRTYTRNGDVVTAPCAMGGSAIPETVAALVQATPMEA